ncbi:MAG TPA: EamA family transporter [Gemmatimonadales bacterium]|nr:EamA family transporter [Gemmatimonadales bacterium]
MNAPTHATTATPPRWQVLAAFAAIYLIWGSTYLAIRFAIDTVPPFLMAGTRFLVAGLLLTGWARLRGAPRAAPRHWASATLLGFLFLVCGNGGVVWSEQRLASGLAALLVAIVPVWTVLFDWLRPGGRRPGALVVAGLLIGLAGVAILVIPGGGTGGAVDLVGALAVIGATIAWAIAAVSQGSLPLPASPLLATGMEMLMGGVLLLAVGAAHGELARFHLAAVTPRSALALAYLIVFGSLVAFTAFVWLLRVTQPARVATYAYVNPVVAVLLGWAFAGEALSARTLVGAGVIVAGVVLITTARARAATPAARAREVPAEVTG